MGHDGDDGSIKEKISILAKNLKTEESKCTFVNFLADSLPQNEKKARGQDAKSLKDMAILANNFNSPKLKCAYADVIAFCYSHARKRLFKTDDEKLKNAKKRKLQYTESLWQCDECGKKLSNKSNFKRHLNIHTKKTTQKQSDTKEAKAKTPKNTVTEKKRPNTPKNTEKQKASDPKSDSNHKCSLCSQVCKADDLYKHYGIDHNIDCPEEILFKNSNVLVYSDRNTEGGEAPWFKEQTKKFFDHYIAGTCKFCDVVFDNLGILKLHYKAHESMRGHNVDPSCMEAIDHLFRAEKNAHLAVNIPQRNIRNTPRKNTNNKMIIPRKLLQDVKDKSGVKADIKVQTSKQAQNTDLLMFVCECGVATEKYDSAVEHSQRHLVNCPAVTQTCDKCEFTFEAACYADHAARHQNDIGHDDFIQLKYDFAKLQSSDWFDMLKDLSPIHKDQIKNASIYKYTRNVKLNPKAIAGNSGVPVYECAKCQLCIDPEKVEYHCNNGKICLKYKRSGHNCPKCDLIFHSDNVLKAHKEDHKIGPPRLITFNNKDDYSFNRALLKLEHIRTSTENVQTPDKVTSARVEGPVQKPKINVISDSPVVVNKLCIKCNTFVNFNAFKAHSANHEEEEKSRSEREFTQEPCLNNVGHDDHGNEIVTENVVHSEEHVNRQQESDSDSCPGVEHSVVVVNAMIHEGEKQQEAALARDIPRNTEHTSNHEENIDESPEQLMLNLYDGIGNQTPLGIDEETQCTQELLITLGENDVQDRNSADTFVDDIMQENRNVSDAGNGSDQAENDATTADTNNKTESKGGRKREKGGRLSSRDQLRIMLSDDESIEDFEELNAKISQLIFSRD